jgi:CubicO group peptidase (beta-lactamase class C family)
VQFAIRIMRGAAKSGARTDLRGRALDAQKCARGVSARAMVRALLDGPRVRCTLFLLAVAGCSSPAEEIPSPDASATRHGIPLATPEQVGIDPAALARLEADAAKYQTSALLVLKDGFLVEEKYFGGVEMQSAAMSASKSFVNLAVGYLVADGKLALSQHAADFIPGWAGDPVKATLTIRQLLQHTSGLDPGRAFDPMTGERLALETFLVEQPMDAPPDTAWIYNNDAVDALALIAERAAGTSLEQYLGAKLFEPIGASPGMWLRFADNAPMGAGELMIDPVDMAKVGLVLADDDNARLPAGWIETSLESTPFEPTCGLLWWKHVSVTSWTLPTWVTQYWSTHGVAADIIAAVMPVVDHEYATYEQARAAVASTLGGAQLQGLQHAFNTHPHFPFVTPQAVGPMRGFYANGWMGQYLFVEPTQHLVVVRMHYPTQADYGSSPPNTEFPELPDDAVALVGGA